MDDILKQIFETADDPMVLVLEDKIAKINPAFCKASGFKEKEVIGKPFLRFIVDRPKVAEAYLKRTQGGKTPPAYETEVAGRDGVYTVTICGTKVEINGVVGVFAILKLSL